MPFIALVYIDDDHTAEAFMEDPPFADQGLRLVGVYDFPSRAELRRGCAGCTTGGRKIQGWTRDKRGFMVCANCGGRNPNLRRWFVGALFDWLGANLYPHAPALFRTPEGYGPFPR